MFLFFDTETTGVKRRSDRLVQIAWLLTDNRGNPLSQQNHVIRPEGFCIPQFATRVHGISTARALADGKALNEVLRQFCEDLTKATLVVGHNISFDLAIAKEECVRVGLHPCFENLGHICTMKLSANWCRLPKFNGVPGFKWPTLQELHQKLFGCPFDSAHDALADTIATKACFFDLLKRGVIVVPELFVPTSEGPVRALPLQLQPTQRGNCGRLENVQSVAAFASSSIAKISVLNPTCAPVLCEMFLEFDENRTDDLFDVFFYELGEGVRECFLKASSGARENGPVAAFQSAKIDVCGDILTFLKGVGPKGNKRLGSLSAMCSLWRITFGHSPGIASVNNEFPGQLAQLIALESMNDLKELITRSPFKELAPQEAMDDFISGAMETVIRFCETVQEDTGGRNVGARPSPLPTAREIAS